ncbi:MAG: Sporulation initiation inhibitor protein Soj [Elusimicrobia bacterium ADurb.Bin231]|nr:MAG: Sporulation initiation inhibitor protein Soj [Elusimicrobia bacterium ADurb.Bin231]
MRTIAVANQKGGCGKTTTAINIAAGFARNGARTLLIDLDPQGHATLGLGGTPEKLTKTVYEVLTEQQVSLSAVCINCNEENVTLIPGNILLSGVELRLASFQEREYVLNQKLIDLNGKYDVCVIDCAPSLSLLVLTALVACNEVVIPVQVHYYAIEGLRQILETVSIVKERFNHNLNVLGILLTFVEQKTLLSRQVEDQMRKLFGQMIFNTVIRKCIRLSEAPGAGKSIFSYAPQSNSAIEYQMLVKEIMNGREQIRTA